MALITMVVKKCKRNTEKSLSFYRASSFSPDFSLHYSLCVFLFFVTIEYIITKMKQNRQRNLMAINLRTSEKESCSVVVMTITNKRIRSAKENSSLWYIILWRRNQTLNTLSLKYENDQKSLRTVYKKLATWALLRQSNLFLKEISNKWTVVNMYGI